MTPQRLTSVPGEFHLPLKGLGSPGRMDGGVGEVAFMCQVWYVTRHLNTGMRYHGKIALCFTSDQ